MHKSFKFGYSLIYQFFSSTFLLACINCTVRFHCDISVYMYNYFDQSYQLIFLLLFVLSVLYSRNHG
jgi:hypothetical protein